MRALLTRLVLAVVLTVSGWVAPVQAGTGAPFAAQTFQGISDPRSYTGLQAWYDFSDVSSLRNNAGAVPSTGEGIKLVGDKSGNSSTNVLCLPGATGNTASAPKLNAYTATDMDIRVFASKPSWFTDTHDFGSTRPAGTGGWTFGITGSGVQGRWYFLFYQATVATQATVDAGSVPAFANYASYWCRVTRNGTTGDVSFYYATGSADTMPSSWTLIQTKTIATGAMDASTATNLGIGARQDLGNGFFNGNIGRFQIRDNVLDNGTGIQFDANFATAAKLATSFTESSSNAATVTINTSGATGARISGARDLYQGTAANQPIYLPWSGTNYGWLNGGTSANFSTPSSAALNTFTTGIDLRFYGAPQTSWTPAVVAYLINKRILGYAYRLYLNTNGTMAMLWSTDNSSAIAQASTATVASALGTSAGWIRATLAFDNGGGNYEVKFYTSTDGTNWTQLGTTVTGVGTTSITAANTDQLDVGAYTNGTQNFIGLIYRAQIYNGIAGTLAFDFNPAAYTSGTTFLDSSSNAATITINGGANIVNSTRLYLDGSNDYLKAAAFALAQPETVYFVGSQVTEVANDTLFDGDQATTLRALQGTGSRINFAAPTSLAGPTTFTAGTNFVLTAIANSTSSQVRRNRDTAVTGNAGTSNANGFTLGAVGNGSGPANITASEVLVYSTADATAQQNAVIGYLARKWSIAGGFAHMPPAQIIPFNPNIAPWKREDELMAA